MSAAEHDNQNAVVEWLIDNKANTVTLVPADCDRFELVTNWLTIDQGQLLQLEDYQ